MDNNLKYVSQRLKERLENMSVEELEQKLKELEPYNNIGPKVDEYMEFLHKIKQQEGEK